MKRFLVALGYMVIVTLVCLINLVSYYRKEKNNRELIIVDVNIWIASLVSTVVLSLSLP